jgi:tRNA(Arg) A34 adenosine deaminase TadA
MTLNPDLRLIDRLLDVTEKDILPLTEAAVTQGNKIFGAAILRKSNLSLVIAGTNNETQNPLWHGEVHTMKLLYEMSPKDRPAPADCIFFATHEPCSLCLSAITWGGYDNFYYLFSHEESRDSFAIPHDLRILKEVFTLDPGGYSRVNAYWTSASVTEAVKSAPEAMKRDFEARIDRLKAIYARMSDTYQASKSGTDIPLN